MNGPIFVYLCAAGALGSLALGVWGCVRTYRALRLVPEEGATVSRHGMARALFALALGWTAITVIAIAMFARWWYAAFMGYG